MKKYQKRKVNLANEYLGFTYLNCKVTISFNPECNIIRDPMSTFIHGQTLAITDSTARQSA